MTRKWGCFLAVVFAAALVTAGGASADNLFSQTTTTLTVTPTSATAKQAITFAATVTSAQGGNPTGSVEFDANSATGTVGAIGTAALTPGPAGSNYSTAVLQQPSVAGSFMVTATFKSSSPLDWFASTSTAVSLSVQAVTLRTTTVVLTLVPQKIVSGHPVTLAVRVVAPSGGPAPTGSVNFTVGAAQNDLTSAILGSAGAARVKVGGWRPGRYLIRASYGGDAADTPAHAQMTLVVTRPKR